MQIHSVKLSHRNKPKKRVGRGGKRGTYSGRGMKGQKARAGNKPRPQMRDTIKKIPKKRGYKFSSVRIKPVVINVDALEAEFQSGAEITPAILSEKKLVRFKKGARVKILGDGTLTKKFIISGCLFSESAKEAVENAGGTVQSV